MMDARQVRMVVTLAEHGSLVRAGRVLGMSPSALTRALTVLEEKLRAPLFDRSRRGLEPTMLGRAILAKGSELLRNADELSAIVRELRGQQSETLVVSAGPFAMDAAVSGAAALFLAQDRTTQLRLEAVSAVEAVRHLRERRATLAVAEISDLEAPEELEITPLRRHPLFVLARPTHPLFDRPEILARGGAFRYPIVVPPFMSARFASHIAQGLEAAQGEREHEAFPAVVTETVGVALSIAAGSDAIVASTAPAAHRMIRSGDLAILPWRPAWLQADFGVLQLRGRRISAAVRLMAACIEQADAESFELARTIAPAGIAELREEFAIRGRRTDPALVSGAHHGRE